ncbi:MAG TPA: RidA family protein [Castellaniella sp.]|uniref:RidA family protein n=1 Tax=Castellaniella sp. TaxID=1955812 RepID=UPI002F106795
MIAENLSLPTIENPAFRYSSARVHDDVIWTSGLIPKIKGVVEPSGIVGESITLPQACAAARLCALQGLAIAVRAAGGRRSAVRGMLTSTCYVACTAQFAGISDIADAAQQVMADAFGKSPDYVRSTVGVVRLPANSPVMFDFSFVLDPSALAGS